MILLKLPNARWFSIMLSSRLQKSSTHWLFKTGLASTQMEGLNQNPVVGNPACQVMAPGEAGKSGWRWEMTTGQAQLREPCQEQRWPFLCQAWTRKRLLLLVPSVIHLPLRYTVSDLLLQNVLFVIFYCMNGQWASQRLEWWQLLALCCQGKYLAAYWVSWEQVSTWPQSFPNLS